MSAVTAREVLGLLERHGARLLAGDAGLERAVTQVSAMRARQPAFAPLQGGELALMSLTILRALRASDDSLTLARFIQDLAGGGVAAIAVVGLSPPRQSQEAPGQGAAASSPFPEAAPGERSASPEELALATVLELPLLGLPWGTAFAEMERVVQALLAERQAAGMLDLGTQREVYGALVRASLRGDDDNALGQRLASMLGVAVALEDERDLHWCHLPGDFPLGPEALRTLLRRPSARAQLRALDPGLHLGPGVSTPGAIALPPAPLATGTTPRGTSSGAAESPEPLALTRELLRLVAPLPLLQSALAYLSLITTGAAEVEPARGRHGDAGDGMAALADVLNSVAPLFALALARQHDRVGVERRLRTETLDALLAGTYADEAQMRARALQVGHDLSHPLAALVVELTDQPASDGRTKAVGTRDQGAVARVAEALAGGLAGAWARERGHEVVALVPLPEGSTPAELANLARQAAEALGRTLGATASDWSAGLGQPAIGAAEARRSYEEARASARLGAEVLGPAHVAQVADLGIYRLLLRLRETGELEAFCRQTLGPLSADARSGDALLETLEVFFACNGNLSAAARRLHLHRNSLIYRLGRARELLGHDLEDPETRLALQLALKGRRVLGW